MSSAYTGVAANFSEANRAKIAAVPVDGDPPQGSTFASPFQSCADMAEYLYEVLLGMQVSNWTHFDASVAQQLNGICFVPLSVAQSRGHWVIVGDSDGTAGRALTVEPSISGFTTRTSNAGNHHLNAVASKPDGSLVVAVGDAGTLITSADQGATWTARTSNAGGNDLFMVAWSAVASLWVAAGANAALVTSPDGITWTARTSNAGAAVAINWASESGSTIVACLGDGQVITSTNGTTWTKRNPGLLTGCSGIAWSSAASLFVLVGANTGVGKIVTSPDGTTWTSRTVPGSTGTTAVSCVIATARCLVALLDGDGCAAATSFDGVTWSKRGGNGLFTGMLQSAIAAAPAGYPAASTLLMADFGGGVRASLSVPTP